VCSQILLYSTSSVFVLDGIGKAQSKHNANDLESKQNTVHHLSRGNMRIFSVTAVNSLQFTLTLVFMIGLGARSSIVVEALCYKPEERGFDTQRGK
jgi:hypothetical protein